LNEEIADILENNNFNLKEISNLKNIINSLQNELKQEKAKHRNNKKINIIENNYTNNNNFSKNTISTEPTLNKGLNSRSNELFNPIKRKNISSSNNKDDIGKEESSFTYHNKSYENLGANAQEIIYLKKKIDHLYETITNLKNENDNLAKENEKLKLNIKNLNRIIAKMYKNMGDGYNDNNDSLHNDTVVKSNPIKTIKAKIIDFKTRHEIQFSGNKRFKKNKNFFNYNTINNDDITRNNSRQKYINLTINTNYDREYDDTFNEEEHNALLKKIQDENKNISLKINELYHRTDYKTLDKDTSNNSIGYRPKKKNSNSKKHINLKKNNKNMNFNFYASTKGNKGSVPKIKVYRKNVF
jgi:regulator of replication initiation timing